MIKDIHKAKLLKQNLIYRIDFDLLPQVLEIKTKEDVMRDWTMFNLRFYRVLKFKMNRSQPLQNRNIRIEDITLTQDDLVKVLIKTADNAYTFEIVSKDVELQILQEDKVHWVSV